MRGACEFKAANGDWTMAGAVSQTDRAAARQRTETILGRVLALSGLQVACASGTIRLAALSGEAERLCDTGGVWATAERLTGTPFDPLADAVAAPGQVAG